MTKLDVNIRKYNKAVQQARELLKIRENAKMRIAKLAYENCDVILGGHITGEIFSLTMFAKDINMSRKTLSDWVTNYQIKISIEKEKISLPKETKRKLINDTPETQNELNKIRKVMRKEEGGVRKNLNKQGLKKAIKKVYSESPEDEILRNLTRHLKNLDYHITEGQTDLEYVDQKTLSAIHDLSKRVGARLDRYFAVYEKPKVQIRKLSASTSKASVRTKARNLRIK